MNVKFKNYNCEIRFSKYVNNNRTAIGLFDTENGENVAIATINMPDEYLKEDEVIIKDYSENEGMLDCLVEAGIISEPIRLARAGYQLANVCKLLKRE